MSLYVRISDGRLLPLDARSPATDGSLGRTSRLSDSSSFVSVLNLFQDGRPSSIGLLSATHAFCC